MDCDKYTSNPPYRPQMTDINPNKKEDFWSKGKNDIGLITTAKPVIIKSKTEYRPRVKQYPLKPDAERGVEPVIRDMLQAGIIKEAPECQCNTPIFPVKKG